MMRKTWALFLASAAMALGWGRFTFAQAVRNDESPAEPNPQTAALDDQAPDAEPKRFVEVIGKSMFGKQPDPERAWTPLTLGNLREGWFDAWIAPPGPTGGSRRQGWVGSNDAFFNRMLVGIDSYTNGLPGQQDEHVGVALFESPVTRRYMIGVFAPFVDSLQNGNASTKTAFGDVTLVNRFLLHETQDTTLSFNLNVKVPTGVPSLGGNRTSLIPYLAMFKDIGGGFSLRGIAGVDSPLDSRPDGIHSTLMAQLGIGQTLTPHDVPLLGDFTYYVMANYRESLGPNNAFVSLTPGLRTHLGHNFWLLGGVEVPVSGPRAYQDRLTIVLVKGY